MLCDYFIKAQGAHDPLSMPDMNEGKANPLNYNSEISI